MDVAINGMRMLVETKRAAKSPINLEWQFLVHAGNVHEVDDVRKLADELGIYLRLSPLGGIADAQVAAQWLPKSESWRDNEPTDKPHRDFPCYWLWRAIVVNSNGQLGRCPGESNVHQLGDIRDQSLMSI